MNATTPRRYLLCQSRTSELDSTARSSLVFTGGLIGDSPPKGDACATSGTILNMRPRNELRVALCRGARSFRVHSAPFRALCHHPTRQHFRSSIVAEHGLHEGT